MPFSCHYLLFDAQSEDEEGVLSLEAVASVRLHDWPSLQAEAAAVLDLLSAHFQTPALPLDEGGVWDACVQVQVDEAASEALAAHADALRQWSPPPSAHWIALTFTVACGTDGAYLAAILTKV
ncbi:MAG: hypothetical protein RLZZ612_738 [Pseudomonadota bacterium]|jgi:hypothetical protein